MPDFSTLQYIWDIWTAGREIGEFDWTEVKKVMFDLGRETGFVFSYWELKQSRLRELEILLYLSTWFYSNKRN